MPKQYSFNPSSGQFEEVKPSLGALLLRGSLLMVFAIGVAVFLAFVFYRYVEPPQQRLLRQDNRFLRENYSYMLKEVKDMEKLVNALETRDRNLYRLVFESEPEYEEDKELQELMEVITQSGPNTIRAFSRQYDKRLDTLMLYSSLRRQQFAALDTQQIAQALANIPAMQPVRGRQISSGYGYRIHPIYKIRKFNYGVDYQAPSGTPVYATAAGTVSYARNKGGYGKTIIIDHGNDIQTWYTHLKTLHKTQGSRVTRGEMIGKVGNTGVSISPHLHYEIHINGKPVNPVSYFFGEMAPKELMAAAKNAATINQSM